MNPDVPDVSIPRIPLAMHLIRAGHPDVAAQILFPAIAWLIDNREEG